MPRLPFVFDNNITHSVPYGSILSAADTAFTGAVANSILKKAAALSPVIALTKVGLNYPDPTASVKPNFVIRRVDVYSSDSTADTLFGLWDTTDSQAVYIYRIPAALANLAQPGQTGVGGVRLDFTADGLAQPGQKDGLTCPPGWFPFVFSESSGSDAVALVCGYLDIAVIV